MFRLFRLIILVLLAFAGGIVWGDLGRQETCVAQGGEWRAKTCFVAE